MAHIHTEPGQHDITASAFVVRDDIDEPRVLLHMHRKLHRLLQPGGHVELDEHLWSSIAHELEEEAGYSLADLEVLQPKLRLEVSGPNLVLHPQPLFVNTHAFPQLEHAHIDTAYLFLAHKGPSKPPLEGESTDLRWLTRNEIQDLSSDLIHEDTRTTCLNIFDRFLQDWEPVPATKYSVEKVTK